MSSVAFALELMFAVWHWLAMERAQTKAGGCFLTLFILGGLAVGVHIDNPMQGILIGTGIGALIAVLLWLADRRTR